MDVQACTVYGSGGWVCKIRAGRLILKAKRVPGLWVR